MESKYGIRWVTNPEAFGYERAGLTMRLKHGEKTYKIANPLWSELENTILKMARKRAEVDAAMALPGVSRFMAKLNSEEPAAKSSGPPSEDWSGFWRRTQAMGLTNDEVHLLLGVKSMKEWRDSGRTMNEAIRVLSEELDKAIKEQEG